jgi:predicted phosphoribosyltransferase
MVVLNMAKKRAKAEGPEDAANLGSEGEEQIRIRMSPGFKAWLQDYANFRQLTMTSTIVQALIRDAKAEGFDPPPKR